jgi:hypothetical protein
MYHYDDHNMNLGIIEMQTNGHYVNMMRTLELLTS